MPDPPQSLYPSAPPHRRALLRYVALWLVAGGIVAIVGLQLLSGGADDEVSLPPVRETELTDASRTAGCELRQDRGEGVLQPPVDGPPGPASGPGVYTETPPSPALVGAIRRGIVLIHYRRSLEREAVEQLERLQAAAPEGTIVTPNENMRYEIAVTAWRRLVGCRSFHDETVDAIQLFRGRYVGAGPDE